MLKVEEKAVDRAEQQFCERFLSQSPEPRFVMGRNEFARSVATCVNIEGYIDEFTDAKAFNGKPIFKLSELPTNSLVVSCAVYVKPRSALERIRAHGLACIDYVTLAKLSQAALLRVGFLDEASNDFESHYERYQWVYGLMEDLESKQCLQDLVSYRIHRHLSCMANYECVGEQQYFEPFLRLSNKETFVDAGGFDGTTTLELLRRCGGYKAVHFFEPDARNMTTARTRLKNLADVHFHDIGLAECKLKLRFNGGEGSASGVSQTGGDEIELDSLDNIVSEPVSFIKMDIEGAEGRALAGARRHILEDHPKLAICCYHRHDDLWCIPQQVLSIRADYRLYLRHYTEGLHESVMFFVPDRLAVY